MKIWGLYREQVYEAYTLANEQYGRNVAFKRIPEKSGRAFRVTLTVRNSHEAGSRRSRNLRGIRRVSAACWHVHRDFMKEVFRINPEARIQTALADYKGLEDFQAFFPVTGGTNVGSRAQPLAISEACNCPGCIAEQLEEKVH